ncbi:MAG: hypothetical protein ACOY4A_12195 [Pseudomonadota bacterium]|uniref:hypothetical protein n=1 Tax=Thermomonas sp. TaxID=1971895 RepID=UPI001AC30FD0|nr:hypothetical protein [Xanthomonadales bacterium]MBN8769225.1 hypothetical protein [Stenotrophomonas sp.]
MSLQPAYRVSVQVPPEHVQAVQDGICAVEPLRGGHYDRVLWIDAVGEEQFRPLPGANPAYGSIGEVAKVASVRLVFTLPRDPQRLARVIELGIRPHHPWEAPAIFVDECWMALP